MLAVRLFKSVFLIILFQSLDGARDIYSVPSLVNQDVVSIRRLSLSSPFLALRVRGGDSDSDHAMPEAERPPSRDRKPGTDSGENTSLDSEDAENLRTDLLADLDGLEEAARLLEQLSARARAENAEHVVKLRGEAEKLVAAGPC